MDSLEKEVVSHNREIIEEDDKIDTRISSLEEDFNTIQVRHQILNLTILPRRERPQCAGSAWTRYSIVQHFRSLRREVVPKMSLQASNACFAHLGRREKYIE